MDYTKTEAYQISYDHVALEVRNFITHKLITKPRRRYVRQESCQVFLGALKILELDRHWRPGEVLTQLDFLKDPEAIVKLYQQDFLLNFQQYCQDPVTWISQNALATLMQDPWCFEHETFEGCLKDFQQAYHTLHTFQSNTLRHLDLSESSHNIIKSTWKITFDSQLGLEDLIRSGFLIL